MTLSGWGFWRGFRYRRFWRRSTFVLLGVLTLLWVIIPVAGFAQTESSDRSVALDLKIKAPVVVDGREVFQISGVGNLSASERAAIVNGVLAQEVRSPREIDLQVAQEEQLVIIRNDATGQNLITVNTQDVTTGINPRSQAIIWRRRLESVLQQGRFERSPAYYRQAILYSLVALGGAIACHVLVHFLGKLSLHQLAHRLQSPASPLHPWERSVKLLVQLAILGLQAGLWVAIAYYITDLFPQIRAWRYRLFDLLTARVISLGEQNYSALGLLFLLALTIGLWFAVSGFTSLFKTYVLSQAGAERRVQEIVAILIQYVLTFLGMIVLLQIWGLDVRSLAILASVLGVGIGFGVQNITNNLISGLIITLERPIQVGDFVNVETLVGVVERIGARSTEIRTLDQVTIIVPNSRFLESEVVNWSHGDPVSRLHVPVSVAYESDIEQVEAALLEAARSHPDVLVRPEPQVWFQGFGESALEFDLLVWTGEPKKQFLVKSQLYYRITATLRRYEIDIPFPQRDLNVRSPHLEALITILQQLTTAHPGLKISNGAQTDSTHDRPALSGISDPVSSDGTASDLNSVKPFPPLAVARSVSALPEVDLETLVTELRSPAGLKICDRSYRHNLYPSCFLASELVEWLVQTQNHTRETALDIGQQLVAAKIIHHVLDDRPFEDGYLFYRFYCDEPQLSDDKLLA